MRRCVFYTVVVMQRPLTPPPPQKERKIRGAIKFAIEKIKRPMPIAQVNGQPNRIEWNIFARICTSSNVSNDEKFRLCYLTAVEVGGGGYIKINKIRYNKILVLLGCPGDVWKVSPGIAMRLLLYNDRTGISLFLQLGRC